MNENMEFGLEFTESYTGQEMDCITKLMSECKTQIDEAQKSGNVERENYYREKMETLSSEQAIPGMHQGQATEIGHEKEIKDGFGTHQEAKLKTEIDEEPVIEKLAGNGRESNSSSNTDLTLGYASSPEAIQERLERAQSNLRYHQKAYNKAMSDKANGWIGVDVAISDHAHGVRQAQNDIKSLQRDLKNAISNEQKNN